MQLQANVTPAQEAQVSYAGQLTGLVVSAGQMLRIETAPEGIEVLQAQVPDGKEWKVTLRVEIEETDV